MFEVIGRLNLCGTAVAAPICHGWVVSLIPYSSPIGALIHFSYEAVQLTTIAPLALYEGEAPCFLLATKLLPLHPHPDFQLVQSHLGSLSHRHQAKVPCLLFRELRLAS